MHVPSPRFVNIQTLSGSQAHCNCCQLQLPWVHLQVLLGVLANAGSDRKLLNLLPAFALPARADRFALRADIILPSLPIYWYAAILLTADIKIPKCLTTKTNIISCSPSPPSRCLFTTGIKTGPTIFEELDYWRRETIPFRNHFRFHPQVDQATTVAQIPNEIMRLKPYVTAW